MYYINVQSHDDSSSDKPYQTILEIVPTEKDVEEDLRIAIQWETNYLNTYINPILWILTFSPLFIYISKHRSSIVENNQLLGINEDITFSFKRKSQRKHFEKNVIDILNKFIDKRIRKRCVAEDITFQ